MKARIFTFITALFALVSQAADQTVVATLTADTPASLLAGGNYVIKEVTFLNADATNARVFLYDAATGITNIVRAAYTSYAMISSNWVTTFTNSSGLLVTNTFAGLATVGTAHTAVTNERPKLATLLVKASDIGTRTFRLSPKLGVSVYATQAGDIELVYEQVGN